MEHQPPPINYPSPRAPLSGPGFLSGLTIGSIASLLLWPAAFHFSSGPALVIVVISCKLVFAIVTTISRDWRQFGAGLFASMGVGALIFFGTCFANLDNLKI